MRSIRKRYGERKVVGQHFYLRRVLLQPLTKITDEAVRFASEGMMAVLNSNQGVEPEKVLKMVKADVDRFVGDAPQFDDLTMLCVRYNGIMNRKGGASIMKGTTER